MLTILRAFFVDVFLIPEPTYRVVDMDTIAHYRATLPGCVLDGAWVACDYDDGLRESIHRWKYRGNKAQTRVFAGYMRPVLDSRIRRLIEDKDTIIVSVPATLGSRLRRGYEPSALLAQALGSRDIPYVPCIQKIRRTKRQSTLDRAARLANIRGAFGLKGGGWAGKIKGKNVVIVDDLITTGATANEVAKVLRDAGAERIYGLFLARHDTDDSLPPRRHDLGKPLIT